MEGGGIFCNVGGFLNSGCQGCGKEESVVKGLIFWQY